MRSVIVRLDPPGGEMVSDAAQNGGLCPLLRRPLCRVAADALLLVLFLCNIMESDCCRLKGTV